VIVVAGESLIDIAVDGGGRVTTTPGGGPYNVARTVARLGQPCTYVGPLSDDRFGRLLRSTLVADGVQLGCPTPLDSPTTLAVAELDDARSATYRFYVEGTAAPALTLADARAALPGELAAIHVGTLGLVLEPMASSLEALIGGLAGEVLVMVDPNCRPSAIPDAGIYRDRLRRVLQKAHVVKVSRDDLNFLFADKAVDNDRVEEATAIKRLLDLGPKVVLLTDGGAPVHAFTASAELVLDIRPAAVVDTVGAGDAFGGAFLSLWVAQGLSPSELEDPDPLRSAATFAIEVAARTCERPGADPPRIGELPRSWQRALGIGDASSPPT
jgi:fructokinase